MKTELFNDRLDDVLQYLSRLEEALAARTDLTEENGGMVWVNISEARQILDVIGFVQTLPKYLDLARGECALKFALRVIRKASEGDCVAAGTADEKPDGQAYNADGLGRRTQNSEST